MPLETEPPSIAQEPVYIGFIKAKFAIVPDLTLGMQPFDKFTRQFKSRRQSEHFVYIAIGHSELPDNETGREFIRNIERLGGKITRLDFTIDVLTPFAFTAYYDLMCDQNVGTPTLITSPRGDTVYIGRRSSARMLRIYNKRREIEVRTKVDIGFDITRIELEVKRMLVVTYKRLFMSGNLSAIFEDICTRYMLPGLIREATKIKPDKIAERVSGPMAFVHRYRRIIRDAFLTSEAQFYETIGVMKDGCTILEQ